MTTMTEPDLVIVDVAENRATITLNRPEKRNALTVEMYERLLDILTELPHDRRVRAVVLTGAGRSFCSGADVSALRVDDAVLKAAVKATETALRDLPLPTVAAIRGHCWGGGMQLAIACDLRLATADATFAVPPARLGVVYPAESICAMTALVGPAVTKRLIYAGDPIDVDEAWRVGLVDQRLPAEPEVALDEAVTALLDSFRPRSLLSQAAGKQIVNACVDAGGEGRDAASSYHWYQRLWPDSGDGAEGPQAFFDKRAPQFRWHPADLRSCQDQERARR